jgi:hypothetical protein
LKEGYKRRWSFLAGDQGNKQREHYGDGDHNRTSVGEFLAMGNDPSFGVLRSAEISPHPVGTGVATWPWARLAWAKILIALTPIKKMTKARWVKFWR